MAFSRTRREIYDVYASQGSVSIATKIQRVTTFILNELNFNEDEDNASASEIIRRLCYEFKRRYCRKVPLMNPSSQHKDWLDKRICFQVSPKPPGRPNSSFEDLSMSQKRRRVGSLRESATTEELALACEMNARDEGKEDAAKLIHTIFESDENAKIIRSAFVNELTKQPARNFSPEEALGFSIHLDLSKVQYQALINDLKDRNYRYVFPSYNKLQEAADKCCPVNEHIHVTEEGVRIELQALLDITVSRLLQMHGSSLLEGSGGKIAAGEKVIRLVLESKWGFDGSSGHSKYKEKTKEEFTDGSVFMSCLVPLRLFQESTAQGNEPQLTWINRTPSSTRFCRLISFEFEKETEAKSVNYFEEVQTEISKLKPTETKLGDVLILTEHRLFPCMVDGKICSALSSTSTLRCHACGAYPSEMNNLEKLVKRTVSTETYKFGLSPLHFRIRLDFKKWRADTPELKAFMAAKKAYIQDRFRKETGLLLDCVKQGFGTTNDGNTARRFFRDPANAAEITGVDINLITRLGAIAEVLSCGRSIDMAAFRSYSMETYGVYIGLYPWYYMPQSLHKVLYHGADIMETFPLPLGFSRRRLKKAETRTSGKPGRSIQENIQERLLTGISPGGSW